MYRINRVVVRQYGLCWPEELHSKVRRLLSSPGGQTQLTGSFLRGVGQERGVINSIDVCFSLSKDGNFTCDACIVNVLVGLQLQVRQLGKLLDEDPAIMQRRVSLAKRLELYRAAQAEIDTVAWSK